MNHRSKNNWQSFWTWVDNLWPLSRNNYFIWPTGKICNLCKNRHYYRKTFFTLPLLIKTDISYEKFRVTSIAQNEIIRYIHYKYYWIDFIVWCNRVSLICDIFMRVSVMAIKTKALSFKVTKVITGNFLSWCP